MAVEGKAEIVNRHIEELPMTGDEPGFAADEIYVALRAYALSEGTGRAVADGKGFLCELPNRQSFSPDAAFYTGPSGGKRFFPEPPIFAVEVRSENDHGLSAERAMAQKRADYFAAGTLVVWDVDLDGHTEVIAKYVASNPHNPQFFGKGDEADAEPAVPGWKMPVDALFLPTRAGNKK